MGKRRQSRSLSIAPIRQERDAAGETSLVKLRENRGHNPGLGRRTPIYTSQIIATSGTGHSCLCASFTPRTQPLLPVTIAPRRSPLQSAVLLSPTAAPYLHPS